MNLRRPTLAVLLLIATRLDARGLVVSPAQLGIIGTAGARASGTISVSSSRQEQTQVRISIADFTRDLDGKLVEVKPDQATRSCKAWLEVEQREFTSPASGSVPLVVSARIPPNATGSYWAVVNLEAVPQPSSFAPRRSIGVQIVPRIAVPIIITVGGTEKISVTTLSIDLAPSTDPEGTEAAVVVENDGNTAVLLTGALALERPAKPDSEEVASVDVGPVTSLPGSKVKLKGVIPFTGSTAGLQAHAYLRFGPGAEQTLEITKNVSQ